MLRKSRIDAAGAFHHVMVRGIERRGIFRNDKDRDQFLDRLGGRNFPGYKDPVHT
jgi:putative transposase